MKFIKIDENQKDSWDEFILENKPEAFLQSFSWGKFQESAGRKILRFAILDEDKNFLAVTSVIEHRVKLGLKYWYVPHGPIFSLEDKTGVFRYLTEEISKSAKKEKIIFLRIDSLLNEEQAKIFENYSFVKNSKSVQPQETLILDLGKSEEGLLKEMKSKTRYNIRLAERKGVKAYSIDMNEKNFEVFWSLIDETSRRDKIISHSKEYYYQLLNKLNSDENLKAVLYFAEFDGEIIAANIFIYFGTYAVYLHGASSNKNRNVMAPYLLQWKQICDAKNLGCTEYDFWGISIGDKKSNWQGITRFKKGFGGEEKSYAGLYEIPFNKFLYLFYKLITRNR